jgi:hypothetical protein
VSYVVADSFQETTTTTLTASDIKKVIVVMLLYGTMWGLGLLGIFMCSVHHAKNRRGMVLGQRAVKKEFNRSREDIRQYLTTYGEYQVSTNSSHFIFSVAVAEVLPSVFRAKAGLTRFWEEVSKSHRYLLLFTASGGDGDKKRMLTGLHLLTVQSMLMFILAVFYDLQYPQDNGACGTYETEELCLEPNSVLDSSNHLCRWVSDPSPPSSASSSAPVEYCEGRPVTMTLKTIVIISIYVSMFTALINLVVDFLFVDILFAPTMESTQREKAFQSLSISKQATKQVPSSQPELSPQAKANQTRKVEEVSSTSTPLTPVVTRASLRVKRLSQSVNLELETTRVLPSSTLEAHELAKISVSDMIGDRMSAIKNILTRQETQRRASTRRSISFQKHIPLNETSVADQFVDLSVDIAEQRKELKRSQQEKFDEMWG